VKDDSARKYLEKEDGKARYVAQIATARQSVSEKANWPTTTIDKNAADHSALEQARYSINRQFH